MPQWLLGWMKLKMTKIHDTALVSSSVKMGENVIIGPFCNIYGDVSIGDNVTLLSHISVSGHTTIGEGTKIWPFSVIGSEPQDLKYDNENSKLVIGSNNKIREHVTMHSGTKEGGMKTQIGDNNLFMVGSHIAHDCKVGNNCVFANNATLAGHVEVGDWAILGGLSAVHQWSRVGCHSFIGGLSAVTRDLLPFGMAVGNRANLEGINLIGMRRRNFPKSEIDEVKRAYSILFENGENEFKDRIEKLKSENINSSVVNELINFVTQKGNRSYCLPEEL